MLVPLLYLFVTLIVTIYGQVNKEFTYGFAEYTAPIGPNSITALPYNAVGYSNFRISPSTGITIDSNSGALTFLSNSEIPATDFSVVAASSNGDVTTTFRVKFQGNSQVAMVKYLSVGYFNEYALLTNAPVHLNNFLDGSPTSCTMSGTLPNGLSYSENGITGTATTTGISKITVYCSNSVSQTNSVQVTLSVTASLSTTGLLGTFYRYTSGDGFDCDTTTPYDAFHTPGVQVEQQLLVPLNHNEADLFANTIYPIPIEYGATLLGYFQPQQTLSNQELDIKVNGAAWVYIDGRLIFSSSGCSTSDVSHKVVVNLTNTLHYVVIHYFKKSDLLSFSMTMPGTPVVRPLFNSRYYLSPSIATIYVNSYINFNRYDGYTGVTPTQGTSNVPGLTVSTGGVIQGEMNTDSNGVFGDISIQYTTGSESGTFKGYYSTYAKDDPFGLHVVWGNGIYWDVGTTIDVLTQNTMNYLIRFKGHSEKTYITGHETSTNYTIEGTNNVLTVNSIGYDTELYKGVLSLRGTARTAFDRKTIPLTSVYNSKQKSFSINLRSISTCDGALIRTEVSVSGYTTSSTGSLNFWVEDESGRAVFGSLVSSDTGTVRVGKCLPVGNYYIRGSFSIDSSATPRVTIYIDGTAAHIYSLSGSSILLPFSVNKVTCMNDPDFPNVPVGGSSIGKCPTGEIGSISKRCLLRNNVATWGNIYSTCHVPVPISNFHYGTSKIVLGIGNTITLTPRFNGDIVEFRSSSLPVNSTVNNVTGIITLLGAESFSNKIVEIIGVTGEIQSIARFELEITNEVRTYDNLIGLSIVGSAEFSAVIGAPVNFDFNLEEGTPTICSADPALPDGVYVSITGISGKYNSYLPTLTSVITCQNSVSKTNSVTISLNVQPALKSGFNAYFSKLTAGTISCSSRYNAFTSENSQIGFSTYVDNSNINFENSNTLTPWLNLNYDYISNYIATFQFYIKTTINGNYTFTLGANKAAWLYFNGGMIVDNGGCHDFTNATSSSMALEIGFHYVEIHYISTSSNRGLQLFWKTPGQTQDQIISRDNIFYRPPSYVYYTSQYLTLTIDKRYPSNPLLFNNITKISSCELTPKINIKGLTFSTASGAISGIPTAHTNGEIMKYYLTCDNTHKTTLYITVVDASNIGTFSIKYTGSSVSLGVSTVQMFLNRALSITIAASGDVTRYVIVPNLPSGFSFNENTGTLSGVCIRTSNTAYTVGAINGGSMENTTFNLLCSDECTSNYPIGVHVANSQSLTYDYQFTIKTASTSMLVSKPSASANAFYTFCIAAGNISFSGSNRNLQPLIIRVYLLNQLLSTLYTTSGGGVIATSFIQSTVTQINTPNMFAFNPSSINTRTNTDVITSCTVNGQFTSVTVSPLLPSGLRIVIGSSSVSIVGAALFRSPQTVYTVSVKLGSEPAKTQQVTITVTDCYSTQQYPVSITYKTGNVDLSAYSWKFTSSGANVLQSTGNYASNSQYSSFACASQGTYVLTLSNNNGRRWDTGTYVQITFADIDLGKFYKTEGSEIVSVTDQAIEITNILFAIDPVGDWMVSTQWQSGWFKADYNTNSNWNSNKLNNVTSYGSSNSLFFRYTVPINSNRNALGVTIRFRHIDGCILFINGQEMYRKNIDNSEPDRITGANAKFDSMTAIKLFFPKTLFNQDYNSLAIGFYKHSQSPNTFDLSMLANYEVTDKDCIDISGEGYVINYSGASDSNYPVENAFDLDYKSNWIEKTSTSASTAWVEYVFGDNTYSWFDTYGIRSTTTAAKNKNSNPRRISLSANDGYTTTYLGDYEFNVVANNQPLTKTLFNQFNVYNSVTFTILDRVSPNADTAVSEIIFQACHKVYCTAEGDYPNTMSNTRAIIDCPLGQTGRRTRYCPNDWYPTWEKEDSSACRTGPPANLFYPQTQYNFFKGTSLSSNVYPNVTSLETVRYEINPKFTNGLFFQESNGAITGTPSITTELTLHTITATNSVGSTTCILFISVYAYECKKNAFWPATEKDQTAQIKCPGGYSGNRFRVCLSANEGTWGPSQETECILTRTSLEPLKGEKFIYSILTISGQSVGITIDLLFMDYIRSEINKQISLTDPDNIVIRKSSTSQSGSTVLELIVITTDEFVDLISTELNRIFRDGYVRQALADAYSEPLITIGYDPKGVIDYKPESSVNVLAIVFASIFGVILLIVIGLCVFFRLRSSSKRKAAGAVKSAKSTGSDSAVRGKTTKARSVKL